MLWHVARIMCVFVIFQKIIDFDLIDPATSKHFSF